jgi:hypothetical protein
MCEYIHIIIHTHTHTYIHTHIEEIEFILTYSVRIYGALIWLL